MHNLPLQPIILCGGSGSRLWPLSRESFPKQYLNLVGKKQTSLLQNTVLRLQKLKNLQAPILICNEKHRFVVAEQMREIGIKPKSIILESQGKNTAPAVATGALRSKNDFDGPFCLLEHGIFRERQSEMITDQIRVLLLSLAGYDANIFEFISSEHTAKNIM